MMQEAQPVVHSIADTYCNEDTTSHQSPSKRKTRIRSQSKQGNSSSQITPSSRYTRSQAAPDWTVQEVLVLLREIVAIDEVWLKELSSYQRWKMISDSCMAKNVARSSNQCKRKWEMLLDDYKKIMNWEPQSCEDSYWFLPEEKRKDYGLPTSFQKEVFDAIDAVIQVQAQFDSNNSDPEQIINVPVYETSKWYAGSEISVLYLPHSVNKKEELVTTSKCPKVEESTLKSPEKALVLAGDELITTSKSPEVELITTSKCNEETSEMVELNTTSKNLIDRPEVEELITTSKRHEVEELVTTPKFSERLELEELNTTSMSEELMTTSKITEGLITPSKSPEVDELITTSKSPEKALVMAAFEEEELITTSKSSEVEELITTSKSSEKASVIPGNIHPSAFEEEELITTSKSSEVEELITTNKSSEKASVITAFEQEELITNSKISDKARLITGKLQENAEHVCSILGGAFQDGGTHSPIDSLKPIGSDTELARRRADELIKALAELTNSLDELSDHINRRECAGIVPVDSMA